MQNYELWSKIDDINYLISSHGRVKNLKTGHISCGGNIKKYKALRLKGHPVFYIHRLVGIYFVSNPENKPEINHIDCNTHNNHFSNLAWCTRIENMAHAHQTMRFKNRFSLPKEIQIAKLYNVYGLTYSEIGALFNCGWGSIRHVVDRYRNRQAEWASL